MNRRICLLLPVVLSLLACDKGTPVAPEGTVLAISANPSKIGLNGTSTITVVGRKPDGNPLNPGTEVRFSTDRGSIDSIATIENGRASVTLRGDGRSGTAMVSATTGAGMAVTTTVQIGETTDTKPSLLVSANPNDIPVNGTSQITIIARNADGTPAAAGQQVILTSSLGTFDNPRPVTQADGTATAKLTAGTVSGTATITAILGASEAATTMVSIRDAATSITVTADPRTIQRSATTTSITLTALVINAQGVGLPNAPVTFESDTGSLDASVVTTGTNGVATATLTVKNTDLAGIGDRFTVTARTPAGNGQFISGSTTIFVD